MIVKDSMVLIHLAKITLLERSCEYFKKVIIPKKVYEEVVSCKEYPDTEIIESLVTNKKISIIEVKNKKDIEKANQFNIQKGEAEAVALYWQENADFLATDDDNVRKKKEMLNINIIGTPIIILYLHKDRIITRDKFIESINKLRRIGWFNSSILDKLLLEAK